MWFSWHILHVDTLLFYFGIHVWPEEYISHLSLTFFYAHMTNVDRTYHILPKCLGDDDSFTF